MMTLSEYQKELYARNLLVDGFSPQMQAKLLGSSVFVVGAGGLGGIVLSYLAAAGIGKIAICDGDVVSLSNLQRQILFSHNQIGQSKAQIATERLRAIQPKIEIECYDSFFTAENGARWAKGYDIIVDCSDNYKARYAIDQVCEELNIPMLYGTAEQLSGQVALLKAGGYRKLFPSVSDGENPPGVLTPMPGIVGSIQALETIKYLTQLSATLEQRLLTIDGLSYKISIFKI